MKPKKVFDNHKVIGEVQKNERLKFVITAGARDGYRLVSIREFYLRKADGVWMPGRDGIVVPIKSPVKGKDKDDITYVTPAKEFYKMFVEAMKHAASMELSDPEHELWFYKEDGGKAE